MNLYHSFKILHHSQSLRVCVYICSCTGYIVSTNILILLGQWGHFGLHIHRAFWGLRPGFKVGFELDQGHDGKGHDCKHSCRSAVLLLQSTLVWWCVIRCLSEGSDVMWLFSIRQTKSRSSPLLLQSPTHPILLTQAFMRRKQSRGGTFPGLSNSAEL